MQEMVQDVKVVLKELLFHRQQLINRRPFCNRGIVSAFNRRQLICFQIEKMGMCNRPSTLTAMWMIENGHVDEGIVQRMHQDTKLGFFVKLADRCLQQALTWLD